MTRRLLRPLSALLLVGLALLRCCSARADDEYVPPLPADLVDELASPISISAPPAQWQLVQSETPLRGDDWLHTPVEPPPVQPLFGGDPNAPRRPPETDPKAKAAAPWPDISQPGPDMGDFPNSAYTLPKGRAYVEMAPLTLAGPDRENPSSYTWPFLLRYGATDDVELRIFGSGLTQVWGKNPQTGFSPISIDTKIHMWDQNNDWLIPAMSLECYIQTNWGTKAFTGGWQESVALNFDMLLLKKTNLEWTIGYSGVQDAVNVVTGRRFIARHHFLQPEIHKVNLNVYQLSIQWALEQEITDKLQVFTHGFYNGGILIQQGAGITVGGGLFWKFSPSLIGWGSLNAGLTPIDAPILGQVGFAFAL